MKKHLLYSVAFLLSWAIFLLFALTVYINMFKPEAFGHRLAYLLTQAFPDNVIEFGAARVSVFPSPHIELYEARFSHVDPAVSLDFSSKQLDLHTKFLSLFEGRLELSSLSLYEPRLSLAFTEIKTKNSSSNSVNKEEQVVVQESNKKNSPLARLHDVDIAIEGGAFSFASNKLSFSLESVDAEFVLSSNNAASPHYLGEAVFFCEKALVRGLTGKKALNLAGVEWSIRDLALSKEALLSGGLLQAFVAANMNIDASLFDEQSQSYLGLQSALSLYQEKKTLNISSQIKFEGELRLNEDLRKVRLHLPMTASIPLQNIFEGNLSLSKARIDIDEDSASFGGKATWPEKHPQFEGKVFVHNLSLSSWFTFPRRLPSDVEHLLNDFHGELDLIANTKGLQAPRVEVTILGTQLVGSGSLPSFAKPHLHFDLNTERLDINKLLPSIDNKPSQRLLHAKSPIAGRRQVTSENATANENIAPRPSAFKFSLRLNSEDFEAWRLHAQDAHIHMQTMEQGFVIDYELDNFYEGKAKGSVRIAPSLFAKLDVAKANGQSLAKDIFTRELGAGTVNASIEIDGPIRRVQEWIGGASLKSHIDIADGFFLQESDKVLNFKHLYADFAGKGGLLTEDRAFLFDGDWQVHFEQKALKLIARTKSALPFQISNLALQSFEKLPLSVNYIVNNLQGNAVLDLDYEASDNNLALSGESTLFIRQGHNSELAQIKGNLLRGRGSNEQPMWQGSLTGQIVDLRPILSALGIKTFDNFPQKSFEKASFHTDLSFSGGNVLLHNVQGKIDESDFKASVKLDQQSRPSWQIDAHVEAIDLDSYFPKKPEKAEEKEGGSAASSLTEARKHWPLEKLDDFDLQSNLRIDNLTFRKFRLQNAEATISNKEGVLAVPLFAAKAYEGTLLGHFTGRNTPRGLQSELELNLSRLNLQRLTESGYFSTAITGFASSKAHFTSLMKNSQQMLQNLNGTWSASVADGFFASSLDSSQKRFFTSIHFDSRVKNGMAYTDNFMVKGPDLSVLGKSLINFPKHSINLSATASVPGFSNVPIRITGSLSKPQVSIKGFEALMHSLGNIGSSILNTFGTIITAPFLFATDR